ncbi:MAG: segregation/condensation protein A [Candidatus Buchananbacteria bacterium]|nr:segregation/condensation protein A [Candidatus Buchananbacteria bacterium]
MDYKIALEKFQGPLDLLLQLIESREMDISQVALAEVTDGYLAYLDNHPEISATELADFLVVATKLLVIKSKTLIPQLADDEEDSAEQLEAQLKMYKDYLDASKNIEKIIAGNNFLFSRDKISFSVETAFSPPQALIAGDLGAIYAEILARIDYVVNLPQKVMQQTVTLKEKVTSIRDAILKLKKINFRDVLIDAKNRTEIVISFMALLELIKSGEVAVNQGGVFDDIFVEKA